jgi:polyhydroxyalkanoate synthesis repressor PhaR
MEIRKYPNRRLYDPELSAYVTLSHLEVAVKSGKAVRVIDHKTKTDITREVLFDVLRAQENETARIPVSIICKLIRTGATA